MQVVTFRLSLVKNGKAFWINCPYPLYYLITALYVKTCETRHSSDRSLVVQSHRVVEMILIVICTRLNPKLKQQL